MKNKEIGPRKELSFLVTTNYDTRIIKRSVSLAAFRAVAALVVLLVVVLAAALVLAGAGAHRAVRLSYLEFRNRQLEVEFGRLNVLKQRVAELEEQSNRMAEMLGIDRTPPPVDWAATPADSDATAGRAIGNRTIPGIAPLDEYVVSRGYSSRHQAYDLAARSGTAVRASADGVVADAGTDTVFGKYILLRHAEAYETYYAHLSVWRVSGGDSVRAGQVIGAVGSTGRSSAPHLHFEVRHNGERIDPSGLVRF